MDVDDAEKMRDGGAQLDPFGRAATNALENELFSRHYESQFVNCDIRTFPMPVLGKFPVIMADPPWDIHMELPYGTMADDEMRRMNVQVLQDDGVIFLWVTGRAMELGRECLDIWGYRFVQVTSALPFAPNLLPRSQPAPSPLPFAAAPSRFRHPKTHASLEPPSLLPAPRLPPPRLPPPSSTSTRD